MEDDDLYIVDRRGDAKNVEYGSLHRYSVPAYRRAGYGNILGLSNAVRIDRDASTDKELSLGTRAPRLDNSKRASNLLSSKYGRASGPKLRFINSSSREADAIGTDFIELPSRKRKRESESPEAGSRHKTVDYRSIEGKAKSTQGTDNGDVELDSSSDAGDASEELERLARQQNAVLFKETKASSTVHTWLALVEHQAKLVHLDKAVAFFTSSERKVLADLRMSVLDRAATSISKLDGEYDTFLLKILSEGVFLWDRAKLASKWREALTDCPSSTTLWIKYIDFSQDNHSDFRFENCKETYLQCLRMLQATVSGSADVSNQAVIEAHIHVFLRFMFFLKESGYDELSNSIWQAVLEYHYLMPASLADNRLDERLSSLENFWDSEVPRIGEMSSRGWSHFVEHGPIDTRDPQKLSTPTVLTSILAAAEKEATLHGNLLLSTSPDDDHASIDPFRYVMFGDIREVVSLVVDIPKEAILDAFLYHMGLPPLVSERQRHLRWCRDAHLAIGVSPRTGRRVLWQTIGHLFGDSFDHFKAGMEPAEGGALDNWRQDYCQFIGRALDSVLKMDNTNLILAEYVIGFTQSIFPQMATKAAKRQLKAHPSSLRLYNAYALVQHRLGSAKNAEDVWSTALRMRATLDVHQEDDTVILWHSRFHAFLDQNASPLDHILSICGTSEEVGSTRRLRATRELEGSLDRLLLVEKPQNAIMCINLLAWLAYFTSSNSLAAPLSTFHKYESRISSEDTKEILYQYKAKLIGYHIGRHPYRPADVRVVMEDMLRRFPSNSMFLELYAKVASQDRLRMLVQEGVKDRSLSQQLSVVEWSHRISEEIRLCDNEFSGSTVNAVRATFARALLGSDSTARHCPALWIDWLRWEHDQALKGEDKTMQRVKNVFFDGLRHLPWLQYWVILGVQLLHTAASEREMGQWVDVLMERGLRIRYEVV